MIKMRGAAGLLLFGLVLCLLPLAAGCRTAPEAEGSFEEECAETASRGHSGEQTTPDGETPAGDETPAGEDESSGSETSSVPAPPRLSCRSEGDGGIVACWWWNKASALSKKERGEALAFLAENDVNRVYLCMPDFRREDLASFVRDAGTYGVSVCLLSGDVLFFDPASDLANRVVDEYLRYQKEAAPEERLAALHLDVEPHQRPDFEENRQEILQLYADLVVRTGKLLHDENEKIEWDIPFWFDDFTVTDENGAAAGLLELLADHADTLCLMSYRDRAGDILALCEKEIALCRARGVSLICGVDAISSEGENVSFAEEGRAFMYAQVSKVYRRLKREMNGAPFGTAIHYLDTWQKLGD